MTERSPGHPGRSAQDSLDEHSLDEHSLDEQWRRVKARLRSEFGDATFNSWLKPLHWAGLRDGRATIAVPTRFMRDWVLSHYAERIRELLPQENPAVDSIEIVVQSRMQKPENVVAPTAANAGPNGPRPAFGRGDAAPDRGSDFSGPGQLDLGAPLNPRFTFDSFVVGKSNELAHAAARRVAENSLVPFNPLFLYGGVGLGKTHLMHAVAWHIRQLDPSRKVIYLSAEKFMYQFIRALRFKDVMTFKQKFRSTDVLMIDDVQFIANKESTQEEFFHTFNTLVDNHRQVIISADRSPSDLEGIDERIISRLGWGLVADIHPTDFELRLGILQSKAEEAGDVDVPSGVLDFLARRITSNVRELEGALNRVVAYSTLVGRPITEDMAQEVLQDLLRANDRRVTIDDIQRKVADYFNLRLTDLLSARRARAVARPRQVAMYLAKQLTSRSLPEIGRKFGGRDHTTVMHAVKRIDELRELDAELDKDIDHLRRMLES
ncbi:MAG: chromosomal replication initiator protein DnaA [Sphingomonadales bacterium]